MSNPILESWQANADAWIKTIDNGDLESRLLVTNQAIVDAVKQFGQGPVWDLGCGEGWLARALTQQGLSVVGTDAIPALIDRAKTLGGGPEYHCYNYQQMARSEVHFPPATFGTAVFNFALLDEADSAAAVQSLPRYLTNSGKVIIQTLHPFVINAGHPYVSGWRPGSWAGMKHAFVQPYDHYFRTVGDWVALLKQSGFRLDTLMEPLHPHTQQPASLLLVGSLR